MIDEKIKTRKELAIICEKLRKQNKTIGFTSGVFDLLHIGHIDYLEKAKSKCDILIIGVNSDKSVRLYKDEIRPLISQNQRIKIIAALSMVDYVFIFNERRNKKNIEVLKPDYYFKASDYSVTKLTSKKVIEKLGGKAVLIPLKHKISTTKIINKIVYLYNLPISNDLKFSKKTPAIFLDRDGTINKEIEYLSEPKKFVFLEGAIEGIKKMQDLGYKIIIITTQAGIGLGYFTKEDFYKVNKIMLKKFYQAKIIIDKIYFCPHSKNDKCDCRKPEIGLIKRAEKELNLDLKKSYLIGDKTCDIKAGKDANLKTILVQTGYCGKDGEYEVKSDYIATDLIDATKYIRAHERN